MSEGDKRKFLVAVSYQVEVDAEDSTDAGYKAVGKVRYGTFDAKGLSIRIVREIVQIAPDAQKRAVDEAPFADQVTDNRQPVGEFLRDVVEAPAPVILDEPAIPDDGLPPIATQNAEDMAHAVSAADDIPF